MTNTQPTAKRPRSSHLFTAINFFIALIAIAMAITAWYIIAKQRANLQQTQQQLVSQQQTENQLITQLNKNEDRVNQLIAQKNNSSVEHAKTQANYLIHLAELNLTYAANVENALHLLQSAEQQLGSFNTPDIDTLRQKIKTDIQALTAAPQVNTVELLTTIDQLMHEIKQIPLISTTPTPSPLLNKDNGSQTSWWEKIKINLMKMRSFIVVRKIENTDALALSPDERLLAIQTLLMKLSLAQWALLTQQPAIYQQCMLSAKKILATIPVTTTAMATLNSTIDKLLAVTFFSKDSFKLSSYPPSNN